MKASLLACALLALALAACSEEKSAEPEKPPRPVRAVTVKHSPAGQSLTLTGTVQAQEQVNEAFRVGGKLATRTADLGADVKAGDQIAMLDSSDAENQLKSAQADMTSAQSSLETAQANEQRQKALLQKGVITQAQYDDAKNQLSAAQSQADSAQARLKAANDTLSYTKLQSDATGKVTATGAEVGEVVGVGQMIVRLAKGDGRDAVFNVPARLLRTAPKDPDITLTLSDDASVTAKGKVREVGPQADAATGTYTVKISIVDPPRAMSLGASVVGSMTLDTTPVIQIPGSALMEKEGKPAVWVVGADGTVALQPVEIERHDADTMVVANGLKDGDVVVTAGVQTLVPGQKVRLLAAEGGRGFMTSFNLSEWALRHRSLVWFLIVAVVIAGIGSYMKLGRAEDPSFTIKTMVVQAQWPGATVGDTLDQITDRIEKQLQDTDYLDYLKSYTTAGSATIYVNLNDNARPEDVEGIWQQVRNDVNDMWYQMPQGVQGPFFNTKFGDTYGIVYAFTADGFSQRELRDYVEAVRSQLLGVKDVGKIDLFGTQDEKIYIEFDSRKLAQLNLNRQALIQALQTQNAVTPSGIVQTDGEKILVQVSGGFASEADIAKVNFNVDGKLIRLSDLATVTRGTADPPQPMFRYNGTPAIGLAISMAEGGNNLELGKGIAAAMARITNDLPVGIEPHLAADQPEVVSAAIDDFTEALWEAIAIVMAVSFLSLGLRAGAVVACSIPLVLAAVFIGMEFDNIDLQRISLGALIIALGLLVDDAMITVEMMVSRLEAGDDKHHSAVYAYTHTAFPMLTGTLVTVLGFVPIGFSKSSAGEYTFSLFAVVAMALLISWVVAVVAAPLIGTAILPATVKHKHAEGPGPIIRTFKHVLVLAMRLRWLVVAGALALLVLAGLGFKYIPNQFFPASDRPELLVDLNLKQGSSIYGTEKVAETFDEILKGDPDVDHWTTYVGRGAIRFYLALALQLGNDSYAQAVIVTKSIDARERLRKKLEPILAEKFPQVTPRLYALELGPPIGWPVQYRVTGPDIDKVRDVAYQVATLLDQSPHADKVTFDWIEPQRTLRLVINQDQAHQLGVSSQSIAQALNAVMSGMTVTQVRDGIYLIDVVGRAVESERISPETLLTQSIPLPNGGTVPLVQLASIDYSYDFPIVWRRDRLPTLTVQADVAGGATAPTVVKELQPQIDKISASLPFGYHIEIGGTQEESAKSTASLAAGLPIAGFLILAVLMIQLQSLQLTFLVISVAPFGLIGVVASLLMFQKPLGFVAILGIIALVGMIIRNSVILVHQIELEREAGRDPWDAVVEAAAHRFRPILLTAAAATLGMLPIAPTVFWGPMAYAIIGGLIVATILTLIFLPALYVIWFRIREPKGGATASAPPPGATAPAALTAH